MKALYVLSNPGDHRGSFLNTILDTREDIWPSGLIRISLGIRSGRRFRVNDA